MDPEIKEDLILQLEVNLDEIRNQYASYVSYIYEYIKDKVSVESLRIFILDLPALSSDETKDRQQFSLLPYPEVKSRLEEAKSIHDIFILLQTECASFLNYDVFHLIQCHFKVTDSKSEAMKYPEYLDAYINKHKLSELVRVIPNFNYLSGDSEKLRIKFDIPITSKVAKVVNLKKKVAKILHLNQSALHLIGIEEGCVVVTFLIPSHVADYVLEKLTPIQKNEIEAIAIVWLKCRHHYFSFSGEDCQTDSEVSISGNSNTCCGL